MKFPDWQVLERWQNGSIQPVVNRSDPAQEEKQDGSREREPALRKQIVELKAVIEDLEAFSYTVSHDMRAPLRSIQGYAEILVTDFGDKLGEDGKSFLDRIAVAAQRMDCLIRDVLAISRIIRADWELKPVDLGPVVQAVLGTNPKFRAPAADIAVEGDLPTVLGHEAGITQCLANLLDNAVKFATPGVRPKVRISAEAGESEVRLIVQDNGIGVPAVAHERIFKIFERQSSDQEGNGVGLAIVNKAMERMEGRAGVKSELGGGSSFWLAFKPGSAPLAGRRGTPAG